MVYVTVSFPKISDRTKAFPQEVAWLFTALELGGPITADTLTQSNESELCRLKIVVTSVNFFSLV